MVAASGVESRPPEGGSAERGTGEPEPSCVDGINGGGSGGGWAVAEVATRSRTLLRPSWLALWPFDAASAKYLNACELSTLTPSPFSYAKASEYCPSISPELAAR